MQAIYDVSISILLAIDVLQPELKTFCVHVYHQPWMLCEKLCQPSQQLHFGVERLAGSSDDLSCCPAFCGL